MHSISSLVVVTTTLLATCSFASPVPQASSVSQTSSVTQTSSVPQASSVPSSSSSYWLADIDHSKDYAWNGPSNYQIFRNVQTDFGAHGDGVHDDTEAINNAMSTGGRCGGGPGVCDSSTVTPAIVYFPAGTYLISSSINMYYYTQMIGDPNNLPTIIAAENFTGMAMIDSDPYSDQGTNWYTNQNNFFRQVRNFIINVSPWGNGAAGAGIHWQVAQATSLQNIEFIMSNATGNAQQGIFMDNGSGGFFSDLTFTGGKYGAFLGSQQFTTRNLTFNDCETAIYMNWNWGWTIQGITVNGGNIALDMSNSPSNQTVGSVILADSVITGTNYGIRTAYQNSGSNTPYAGGTLIVNNVDMSSVASGAIIDANNQTVVSPGHIEAWATGAGYAHSINGTRNEGTVVSPTKESSLLDSSTGYIFTRSKPQYQSLSTSSFLSAMDSGCQGDGVTDDTQAMQAFLNKASQSGQVAYFEHGAYVVSDTIHVPSNVSVVGEIWPMILANGSSPSFSDKSHPKPVWKIGSHSDPSGSFEISDMIFETIGPAPGAIMVQWNLQSEQGASGMWDTHARIGGTAGTNLEYSQCPKNTESNSVPAECEGVFLMFHATPSASGVYLENTWFWVADHSLDQDAPQQISIYSGRGMLIEAQGPVWLWGTAAEHSIIYNYNFNNAKAIFAGFMQSETPYFQPNPNASTPFSHDSKFSDPPFTVCSHDSSQYCMESWGLHVKNSTGVLLYGLGLYSFFQNYDQSCVPTANCQQNIIHLRDSQVDMYAVTTIGSVNMIMDRAVGTVQAADNLDVFGSTIGSYITQP